MQRFEVSKHVNTSTSIQVSRLENPQIVAFKVAMRQRELGVCFPFKVESLKLRAVFAVFGWFVIRHGERLHFAKHFLQVSRCACALLVPVNAAHVFEQALAHLSDLGLIAL